MSASGDQIRAGMFPLLTSGRALVVEREPRLARQLARILGGVVGNVDVRDSFAAIERHGIWDVAIINHDQLASLERERIFTRFAELNATGGLLLCTSSAGRDELVSLFGRHKTRKLLARTGPLHAADLRVTLQKTLRRDLFGIEKYLGWGASASKLSIHGSADKDAVFAACEQLASAIGLGERKTALLLTVAEEFTSNALYDAPVDASHRPRYADLPRSERVELGSDEHIAVTVASDGQRIGISVEDPFGSLRAETVVDYLGKCLRKGQDQLDRKPGGAGLGLFYAFSSLSQLVVNIAPRARTELIGLLDVAGNYREFEQSPKSFNVFVAE